MSARDAIINEIKLAPESLVRETYAFIQSRKSLHGQDHPTAGSVSKPDFLARQKVLFGDRMVGDSQVVLDELRAERF